MCGASPLATPVKAIRFHAHGGPEVLRLEDLPPPVARPGEALVRVSTAGVNDADVCQRTGVTPTPRPHIGGVEGVGVVETSADGLPAGNHRETPAPGCRLKPTHRKGVQIQNPNQSCPA